MCCLCRRRRPGRLMNPVLHHLLSCRATAQGTSCSPGVGGPPFRGVVTPSSGSCTSQPSGEEVGIYPNATPKKFVLIFFCVLYSKTRVPIHTFPGRAWYHQCCGSPVRSSPHRGHPGWEEQLLPSWALHPTCLGARMRSTKSPPSSPD